MIKVLVVSSLLLFAVPATAALRIFACEPEWAALAVELGGNEVSAYSATTALQDPHYIQARPSLIAKVRRADIVICSGADLEIGWLPALLQKANNRGVMPGTAGYMEASSFVTRMDKSVSVDRSQGDIHPQGNPHIQTNPHNIVTVADELLQRMVKLDPEKAAIYEARHADFSTRWSEMIAALEDKARSLRGKRVVTHHKSWVYLESWLGLIEVGNLESVPGLPPTATHLSRLTSALTADGADFIVRSPYQDAKSSEWLSARTGINAIVLPITVGGTEGATDLFTLYEDIVDRLLGASQ